MPTREYAEQLEREVKSSTLNQGQCGGIVQGLSNEASTSYRPSMIETINKRLSCAQQEMNHMRNLEELKFLLEKNPEVARILDLIELNKHY